MFFRVALLFPLVVSLSRYFIAFLVQEHGERGQSRYFREFPDIYSTLSAVRRATSSLVTSHPRFWSFWHGESLGCPQFSWEKVELERALVDSS